MKLIQSFEIKLRTLWYARFYQPLENSFQNRSTQNKSTRKCLTQKKAQTAPSPLLIYFEIHDFGNIFFG